MAIRIIWQPQPPPKYRGTCSACRTEIEFDEVDSVAASAYCERYCSHKIARTLACPVPSCPGRVTGVRKPTVVVDKGPDHAE